MKKILFPAFPLVALLLSFLSFHPVNATNQTQTATNRPPADPIRIGGEFALTGDGAALDVEAANGARLALKEINAAGGLLGRPVELMIRDSQTSEDRAAQIAQQFVDEKQVMAVIGLSDSDPVLAAGHIFQAAGIPFVTVGATSPFLPEQIGDRIFLACFGDNVQAAAGAEYAITRYGGNAALIWEDGANFTRLLADYFKSALQPLGGRLILEEIFKEGTTDFKPVAARLKSLPQPPDFIYVAAMPNKAGLVVKAIREAGFNLPIMGGDSFDAPELITMAGAAADNIHFTTHATLDPDHATDTMKRFEAAYRNLHGRAPANAFAALGYDALNLVADAIRRAGSAQSVDIKRALEDTKDFPGITGAITLTTKSHVPVKSVTIVTVRNGRFTSAERMTPRYVPER